MILELVGDVLALVGAGVAVFYAVRAERRLRRERDRTDRLYKRTNDRLGDHIQSRMH